MYPVAVVLQYTKNTKSFFRWGFSPNILAAYVIFPTYSTCPFHLILLGSVTSVLFELVHRLIELYGIIVGLSVSEIVLALPHVEPVVNKK